jgi:hypothetical protein
MTPDRTECSECGTVVDLGKDTETFRSPCPVCQSLKRTIHCGLSDTLVARDGIAVKAKRPNEKRPFIEDKAMPSYSYIREKLVHREMIIDRDNDKYYEKITDYETGEVIHEKREALSAHKNHGSAKLKKDTKNE